VSGERDFFPQCIKECSVGRMEIQCCTCQTRTVCLVNCANVPLRPLTSSIVSNTRTLKIRRFSRGLHNMRWRSECSCQYPKQWTSVKSLNQYMLFMVRTQDKHLLQIIVSLQEDWSSVESASFNFSIGAGIVMV